MGGEVLSQEEVENLLNIMSRGEKKEAPAAAPAAPGLAAKPFALGGGAPKTGAWTKQEKVTPYDFKRPERVGKE
ncbi:MAG: flagellar motor switch protein FliM, partial [Thermoguttaceae bacterium]